MDLLKPKDVPRTEDSPPEMCIMDMTSDQVCAWLKVEVDDSISLCELMGFPSGRQLARRNIDLIKNDIKDDRMAGDVFAAVTANLAYTIEEKKFNAIMMTRATQPQKPQEDAYELKTDERFRVLEAQMKTVTETTKSVAMSTATLSQAQQVLAASKTVVEVYEWADVVPDEFGKDMVFEIDWTAYHDEPAATEPVAEILRETILHSGLGLDKKFKAIVMKEDSLWRKVPFRTKSQKIEASGKTDIVFLPINLAKCSAAQSLRIECVLMSLLSDTCSCHDVSTCAYTTHGFRYDLKATEVMEKSLGIQILHVLAASRISNHPILSVFSDQSTMTRLMWLSAKNDHYVLYYRETNDLRSAAYEMANWLQCSDPKSIPAPFDESESEAHERARKRSRMDDAWKGLHTIQEQEEVSEVLVNELDVIDTFAPSKLDAAVEKFFVMQQHMPWRMPIIMSNPSPHENPSVHPDARNMNA